MIMGGAGWGNGFFWNYTIQKKCNFFAQNIFRCLLLIMIVDKFATHTCISRHTLCLIITAQFTTDWRNRDVQRRFFVNCFNFYKRRKRSCLSSLLFLPHQDERWFHFPNCLAVFITDCKRLGLRHRRTGRGGEGGCSPLKVWATQIFWAARENLGKASF